MDKPPNKDNWHTYTYKRQYLLHNGWWAHYHEDCWFESSLDKPYTKDGQIVGFRPESEGLTLEEAYKKATTK